MPIGLENQFLTGLLTFIYKLLFFGKNMQQEKLYITKPKNLTFSMQYFLDIFEQEVCIFYIEYKI